MSPLHSQTSVPQHGLQRWWVRKGSHDTRQNQFKTQHCGPGRENYVIDHYHGFWCCGSLHCRVICSHDIMNLGCFCLPQGWWSTTWDVSVSRDEEKMQHYNDVIMNTIASQITSSTIVYSAVYSGADQRKYQSSLSLAFVWGIHRWPVNCPHKGSVTRKMFPFDDVIMINFFVPLNEFVM